MIDTIYSIGYAGFSINDFVETLLINNISAVVDVRSTPYSQYSPDYNKDNIERVLKNSGIYYRNYDKEFGARQENRNYYTKEGYLDFELFAKSVPFTNGFDKLVKGMKMNYSFTLMCAEKDPFNCHRTILVARAFHKAGYKVIHLLTNKRTITQDHIENRLLEKYFPDRKQCNLFDNVISESEYIDQAYRKRNAEIGYSIKEDGI